MDKRKYKTRINLLLGFIVLCFFGYFFFKIFKNIWGDHLLKTRAVIIRAVIVDKKNYNPNTTVADGFSYSYRFTVNGKTYEQNAQDRTLRVGDSVDVAYVRDWPTFNKPLHPGDW